MENNVIEMLESGDRAEARRLRLVASAPHRGGRPDPEAARRREERLRPRPIQVRFTQAEHRLALAVLEDALAILARRSSAFSRKRLVLETWVWVGSDDRSWPFTFCNICEALEIDVARLRRRIAMRLGCPAAAADIGGEGYVATGAHR